ncbi:hypothetical protein Smp_142470 [Schistosoma mansoni]|uniref:hypothetical protein n=1 Tax=Schistosoma mansoni TaxID=6183 RepID=UPI0001A63761|nr:hypothetical protein Smp_142470 [Schistosoma mansoni]|eukprot:XP_018649734.1 hypothetical protein Smp_142470 [Schistosoma mansoni]
MLWPPSSASGFGPASSSSSSLLKSSYNELNNNELLQNPVQQNANNTISCNINNSTCSNVSNELYDQNLPCSTPEQQQTHSTTNTTTTITSTGSTIHINGAVHNTLRKTRSDMKVIHRYLIQIKHDTREIHQIPCHELDSYIQMVSSDSRHDLMLAVKKPFKIMKD